MIKIKRSSLLFCVLILSVAAIYQYHQILFFRPYSIHQWRQCDCASFTLNYFKENRPFLDPSVCWIGSSGTGETISEFPIIYYSVAQLWKIFGQHEFIFRLLITCITFLGLYFLFLTFRRFLADSFWSIGLTLLLFTSPIWVYYGNNFMADVPALSIALIGWYQFWKFYKSNKNCALYFSLFFFLLGGLIKISSLISFVALLCIFLIETFFKKQFGEGRKIFDSPKTQIIPFLGLTVVITSWYFFVISFNNEHNKDILLTGIIPIWQFTQERIMYVWQIFTHELIFNCYSMYMLIFILGCFIFNLLFYKKANQFLLAVNVLLAIGVVIFFILWYDVFHDHDYYMTNLLVFSVFTLLNFAVLIKNNYEKILKSVTAKIIFLVFLGLNIFYAAGKISVRYFSPPEKSIYSYILTKEEIDFFRWLHWDYDLHYKALETIEPYNRSLGIKRTDLVISIPDRSFNITLYLMDQKGFTDYDAESNRELRIKKYIQMGAQYLFINDQKLLDEKYLKPFIKNKIGEYKNINIFKLSK